MKKIYFAFILDEKLKKESVWIEYFNNIDSNLYELHSHCYKGSYRGSLKMNNLSTVRSTWRSTLLIHLEHFKQFLKTDCTHLIFVSESCLPIKSFDKFYDFIQPNISHLTGYQDQYVPNQFRRNEYKLYLKQFHIMTISEQWKCLARKHIEYLMQHEKTLIDYFNNHFGDNEHYQTLLYKNFKNELINYPLFYIRRKGGAHPVLYNDIDYNIINSNSFFCRKIHENTGTGLLSKII